MCITGLLAVGMTDGDAVAVAVGPASADNGTAAGCLDSRSHGACPVYAFVHSSPAFSKSGAVTAAGNGLDIGRRCLGTALNDLRLCLCHNGLGNDFPPGLISIFVCHKSGDLPMSRGSFLGHHFFGGIPAVVVHVLHRLFVVFLIGNFFLGHHGKFRLRRGDSDLVADLQHGVLVQVRIDLQQLCHSHVIFLCHNRKTVAGSHLVGLVLFFFFCHIFNGLLQRGNAVRRHIRLRDLDIFHKCQVFQAVAFSGGFRKIFRIGRGFFLCTGIFSFSRSCQQLLLLAVIRRCHTGNIGTFLGFHNLGCEAGQFLGSVGHQLYGILIIRIVRALHRIQQLHHFVFILKVYNIIVDFHRVGFVHRAHNGIFQRLLHVVLQVFFLGGKLHQRLHLADVTVRLHEHHGIRIGNHLSAHLQVGVTASTGIFHLTHQRVVDVYRIQFSSADDAQRVQAKPAAAQYHHCQRCRDHCRFPVLSAASAFSGRGCAFAGGFFLFPGGRFGANRF